MLIAAVLLCGVRSTAYTNRTAIDTGGGDVSTHLTNIMADVKGGFLATVRETLLPSHVAD